MRRQEKKERAEMQIKREQEAAAERITLWWCLNLQPATNKACIGRKAALGLRQIAALLAPSVSTLRSHRHVANAATSCIC
jgi:hypothetical protein